MADVFTHFNYLHAIPEIGMKEFKTSAYVADVLKQLGYEVETQIGGATGVVAVCDSGKPGPVLGLRADMDALGTKDGGAAHLCGHDGHMAMLLAAAEETSEGALSMLKGGAVDDIEILIGMHGRPIQECRVGEAAPALYYSAATHVKIDITGMQSHGARPYLGISALDAACLVVQSANALRFNSNVVYNLKATQIHADAGVANAVPGTATITFDLRSRDNDVMELMIQKLRGAAENAAASIGAKADFTILHQTPASIITPEITEIIGEVITSELGEKACIPPIVTAGGEDFFWYPKMKPELKTGFIALGEDAEPGLHDPAMHFNHDALPYGVKIHKGLVKKFLG